MLPILPLENPDTLSLKTTSGIAMIIPADVLYFSIENHEVKLYSTNGDASIILHSMKELEAIFEPYNFYRCHARFLINLAHVKRYTHKTGEIELLHSKTVKVAFDRKIKFKQLICSTLPPPVSLMARPRPNDPEIGINAKKHWV
jgi:two-component system LytT family response regulator